MLASFRLPKQNRVPHRSNIGIFCGRSISIQDRNVPIELRQAIQNLMDQQDARRSDAGSERSPSVLFLALYTVCVWRRRQLCDAIRHNFAIGNA